MTTISRETWMTIRDDPHKIGELINSDNVNAPLDENGTTPLMLCENAEVAKLLIEIGADFKRSDKSGNTVLSYVNNSSSIREACYKKIKEKLEKAIPEAFQKLFTPTDLIERAVRRWTFVSAISSAKGCENWWKFELLGQLQRKDSLPLCNKDLIVCSEYNFIDKCNKRPNERVYINKKGGSTDLVIGTPDPDGKEWYKTDLHSKPHILVPIELKHCPVNAYNKSSKIISDYFGTKSNKSVYRDAFKIQDIVDCDCLKLEEENRYNYYSHEYDCSFGILALLVTGLKTTQEQDNIQKEVFDKASNLFTSEEKINLSCVVDKEIQPCVIDKEIQLLGETNDIWSRHAWAHQFVWIIEKSKY